MQRIVYRREPNGEPVCCMPSLASIRMDSSFDADNAKICSRHFTDDCFKHGPSGTRRTLIPGSLPTLWMPSKSVETPETTRQEPVSEMCEQCSQIKVKRIRKNNPRESPATKSTKAQGPRIKRNTASCEKRRIENDGSEAWDCFMKPGTVS
ncbi:hypothetical protein LSAT2_022009 [Lamellibrachia satsuma]|nr:hypothetical protein LSAT2_022009 [Lamellibrachia satsuma]